MRMTMKTLTNSLDVLLDIVATSCVVKREKLLLSGGVLLKSGVEEFHVQRPERTERLARYKNASERGRGTKPSKLH